MEQKLNRLVQSYLILNTESIDVRYCIFQSVNLYKDKKYNVLGSKCLQIKSQSCTGKMQFLVGAENYYALMCTSQRCEFILVFQSQFHLKNTTRDS